MTLLSLYSNTTLVKVKFNIFQYTFCNCNIQIQHLLKLNLVEIVVGGTSSKIQIQHLLKLNY